MKAIIMAGGDGARLRPITCTVPKPMVRILDVPVMESAVDLLRRHGIREIAVTLRYLPDRIRDYFGDGSRFGVRIRYFTEAAPLGTAGGVKQAQEFLNEPFIVLSGDGLTDCDLAAAIAFHRKTGAQATLVTVRAADPREYGLVCADERGQITGFCEKPDWRDVVCDRVSTGIYLLEPSVTDRIPPDTPCDFARDLFPAMLSEGLPLYAYDAQCYWCDIGDPAALIRANHDALQGKFPLPRQNGTLLHPTAQIDPFARILPPVYIGENVCIPAHATIGPCSVIASGAHISPGADIRGSVIASGAHIGRNAQLRGCYIAENARIADDAQIFESAVIGAGCTVGRAAEISAHARIWPEKSVPDRMHIRGNLILGHAPQAMLHAGAVDCFTPIRSVQCAQALCAALRPRIVLAAHSRSPAAEAQHLAACAGAMAQGAQVYDCRAATLPELRCAMRHIGADCAFFVTDDAFHPLDRLGAPISDGDKRTFLSLLNRGELPPPYAASVRSPQSVGRIDLIYLRAAVTDEIIGALSGFPHPVAVYAPGEQLLSLAERALRRAGIAVRAEWEEEMMELSHGEIGAWLSPSGENVRLFTREGEITEAEMQLITAQALLDKGEKRLLLPDDCTPAAEVLAESHRAKVERIPGSAAQWAQSLSRLAPAQLPLHFDGIAAMLSIFAMLNRRHLSLTDFCRGLPQRVRHRRTVAIPDDLRAHVLRRLNETLQPGRPNRFHMPHGDSHVWILPSDEVSGCTVLAESADGETAREFCDFYEKILREAMQST